MSRQGRASHPCICTDVGALALKVPGRVCRLSVFLSCSDVDGSTARTAVTGPRGRAKAFQPTNSSISFLQRPSRKTVISDCAGFRTRAAFTLCLLQGLV